MQFLHYIHINLIWICRKPWIFLDFCNIMETTFWEKQTDKLGEYTMTSNFEYYKIFYYVAKYGNLTRAAAALNTSQPAVTRVIHKLEADLGCRLFIRRMPAVFPRRKPLKWSAAAGEWQHLHQRHRNRPPLLAFWSYGKFPWGISWCPLPDLKSQHPGFHPGCAGR